MARHFKFVSIDRVLSKLYRDLGLSDISEIDVIEWTGEALEAIGTVPLLEECVAFIEVKDHKAELPSGLHAIIQVARNNDFKKDELTPLNIAYDTDFRCLEEKEYSDDCDFKDIVHINLLEDRDYVFLDCNGNPIEKLERKYYRPYFDSKLYANLWITSDFYKAKYTPVRLANHNFFNSVVCQEDPELYSTCVDEYTLSDNVIKTSFKDGSIAIAYYKQRVDEETGYPLIPDDYSVITAITMYITMKIMQRSWYLGREGYGDKFQKAEQDWHWYCKQAKNKSIIPTTDDEWENIYDIRNNLLPFKSKYYGFFGKLGRPRNNDWKHG